MFIIAPSLQVENNIHLYNVVDVSSTDTSEEKVNKNYKFTTPNLYLTQHT